ncbi:extracellular calcium-sensing receptor-like [Sphaeramia orbicularis]|uniref:extracellular calcium-sensing receptor-like n=1 Tax=Sphaeramia orbicularis TaxID=375764 RepID=UPI00117E5CC2|nr:extracellular calcium-sensing receptor-like [Sphaeramia orbicularis]
MVVALKYVRTTAIVRLLLKMSMKTSAHLITSSEGSVPSLQEPVDLHCKPWLLIGPDSHGLGVHKIFNTLGDSSGLVWSATSMYWFLWFLIPWSCSSFPLLLLTVLSRQIGLEGVQASVCSRWDAQSKKGLLLNGDVIIGGLFSLYYKPTVTEQDFTKKPYHDTCTGFRPDTVRYIHAMVFAVEEINRNNRLLQGVKLGYRILNSCGRYPWVLQAALILVGGDAHSCSTNVSATQSATDERTEEETGGQTVPLLIGAVSSSTAVMVSEVLAPLSISYIASCPCLSDRHKYPSFFRTIPSDIYQARAMAQLAIRFKWAWVGVVIVNTDYGHSALQAFQKETQGKGVCIDFVQTVTRQTIITDAKKAAITIEASTARVILIFCLHTDVKQIFLALAERNVTDRQFLASEAWSTSDELMQDLAVTTFSSGVIGVAIRSSTIPGFENYLRSVNPYNHPDNVFIRELWEREFGCSPEATQSHKAPLDSHSSSLKSDYPSNSSTSFLDNKCLPKSSLPPCTGTESLEDVQDVFIDMSQLRETYNIYLAVYAAAHALHSLLSCPNRDSPTNNSSTCSSAKHIKPKELLQHLNKVNISTPHGEMFHFQGADILPKYDIINWQKTPDGSLKFVLVGHVNEFGIHLNESVIQWNTGSNEVPVSVCSKSCPPGTRKANRKGEPVCCFDCIPCGEGEISNITGSLHCERCPSEFWSNNERTVCIRRQTDFLSFNETLGITLTTVAVSGVLVTTAVFVVFLYYRQTPMVRANNSELSFLLLLSLKLCFLCSLVFIGHPSVWSCWFQQAAFGISFVLCVSCLLVKTMVVLAAFRSARPGAAALMKWFGPGLQRGSVCLFTSVQIIICIIWLSLSPPVPHRDLGIQRSKVTLKCAMASVVGFSLVLGYIGLLACTCLHLAFLARKLPDNFNEAKLITFSMLIFCAVWVAFVPAYVSSPGKYVVAVEIFAILASSYGLLFCIFAPKCFIIILRPEKNTKKHLMGR